MAHPNILDKDKTALVVVDLQEAFRSPINDFAQIASRVSIAVRGFQILNLPIIVTEQYPKGLGRTAEEILFSFPPNLSLLKKQRSVPAAPVLLWKNFARPTPAK
jgi:nicotinamidase-related amidase